MKEGIFFKYHKLAIKYLIVLMTLSSISCNKEIPDYEITTCQTFLADKSWYLTYEIGPSFTHDYTGQSTFVFTFSKNGTGRDSDGLSGNYSIEKHNNILQIHFQDQLSGVEYIYSIKYISRNYMILSFSNVEGEFEHYYSTSH